MIFWILVLNRTCICHESIRECAMEIPPSCCNFRSEDNDVLFYHENRYIWRQEEKANIDEICYSYVYLIYDGPVKKQSTTLKEEYTLLQTPVPAAQRPIGYAFDRS